MVSSLKRHRSLFSGYDGSSAGPSINLNRIVKRICNYWPELLVFVLGIAASVASYLLLRDSENKGSDAVFQEQAADRATVLEWEVARVLGDLEIVTAFMSVSVEWREPYYRARFHNLTVGILRRSPGTQALTWVPMVSNNMERVFLEQQAGEQLSLGGFPGQMQLSSGKYVRCVYYKNNLGANLCSSSKPVGGPFQAAGPDADHSFFPVYWIEPIVDPIGFRSSNEAALMYDLSSNFVRNKSISAAILSKSPSATSRLTLVQESATQFGLIVFYPVEQTLPCENNSSHDCRKVAGLTNAVFRITDLVMKSQSGLMNINDKIRGDQFLLDLGPERPTGAPLFMPGISCEQHTNYTSLGVDELYSSTNATANAPSVQQRLGEVLSSICRAQDASWAGKLANGSSRWTLSGVDSVGSFRVQSFMVADRRWIFVIHSQRFSYREILSTSLPLIVLTVGIVLVSTIITGALIFRQLQAQIAINSFLISFRTAKTGDTATSNHLPPELSKEYQAEEILIKREGTCVVRAVRKHGNDEVAVKLVVAERGAFEPAKWRAMKREALMMAALTAHKCEHAVHLAGVGAFNITHRICWFIMEYEEGKSLDLVLENKSCLTDIECMKFAREVVSALNMIHLEGLIHGDIRPATIACLRSAISRDEAFKYKLIDFSRVRAVSETAPAVMVEPSGDIIVPSESRPYASPELFRDPMNVGFATDIWSLGVTMFELVTASLPFKCADDMMWSVEISGDLDAKAPNVLDLLNASDRSKFDNNFAKVIARCMEKRVVERYQTAEELYEEVYACLISRGEETYSVFLSYRVATDAPLASLIFDELNHTVTPGGHRVTVYLDSQRLTKGKKWEDGFVQALFHSYCFFPVLSYGSTAPLAALPPELQPELLARGWDDMPAGRARLRGRPDDAEDNVLKEWLIALTMLEARETAAESVGGAGHETAAAAAGDDPLPGPGVVLTQAYPILLGRPHPPGHRDYPRAGSFFKVQGGGGLYPAGPSPATSRSAAACLERAGLGGELARRAAERGVESVVQSLLSRQGCQLWDQGTDLGEAELEGAQEGLVGRGSAGPPVDLDSDSGMGLTEAQRAACRAGWDERQLGMLKALVRHKLPAFHEIIDMAVGARARPAAVQRRRRTSLASESSLRDDGPGPPGSLGSLPAGPASAPASASPATAARFRGEEDVGRAEDAGDGGGRLRSADGPRRGGHRITTVSALETRESVGALGAECGKDGEQGDGGAVVLSGSVVVSSSPPRVKSFAFP